MDLKYTNHFLNKIEDVFSESDYHLRYEKGNFKSGYCVLKETKIAIVNKYYTTEGKVNCLIDILKILELDTSNFTDKNKKFYNDLLTVTEEDKSQTKLEL